MNTKTMGAAQWVTVWNAFVPLNKVGEVVAHLKKLGHNVRGVNNTIRVEWSPSDSTLLMRIRTEINEWLRDDAASIDVTADEIRAYIQEYYS